MIGISKLKIYVIIIAALPLAAMGCARPQHDKTETATSVATPPLVALCQGLDYADTTSLHSESFMKKMMGKIVKFLPYTDSIASTEALTIFFNGVKHDNEAIENALRLADLYLNNPASPLRDATFYIRILKTMLAVDSLPEAVRLRAEDRLRTASLNSPGTMANDFSFEDRNKNRSTLHAVEGHRILIIFYDPECSHCTDILRHIIHDPVINRDVAGGLLTVLAVYAEGKRDVWDSTKLAFPADWTVGYDLTGILDKDLYDLPAMPTLYLLDGDHRVLFKDPEAAVVSDYLRTGFVDGE